MYDVWGSILFGFVFCIGGIFFLSGLADLSVVISLDIWISNFFYALRVIGNGVLKTITGIFLIGFVLVPVGLFRKYRWRLRYFARDVVRYFLSVLRRNTQ